MKETSWHTMTTAQVIEELNSSERGLTKEEADLRLQKYGPNKLPAGKVDSLFSIFLQQFQSPLIYVLLGAAIIVFVVGEIADAVIISVVLLFNAIIGTIQEGKAKNALLALKNFSETSATVLRGGDIIISDKDVVPGDIIILQEGEKIPADARIILSNNLKIDEASFTGETGAINKISGELIGDDLVVSERKNMVFKGTLALSGNGIAVVVNTGILTEIGKIAEKIASIDTEIPLKVNIRYLSRIIVVVVAFIIIALTILGISSGRSLMEMFTVAVALSVSIIPEGLPVVMTLVLATGVRKMAMHNVLVKRLHAVEALGQTKIIAVDKTGTLTKNEMVVKHVYVDGESFEVEGDGYELKGGVIMRSKIIDPINHAGLLLIGKISAFCANAKLSFLKETGTWKIAGDPTEAAMQLFSEKTRQKGFEQIPSLIFEMPFDYQKKYHATIRNVDNKNFLTVFGAPEKILEMCKTIWHKNGATDFNEVEKIKLESVFLSIAKKGFRVVACAINENVEESFLTDNLPPLTFVGFLGINDALRVEVKDAVQKVRGADIKVVMITGDHRITAQSIAAEADIWREGDRVITGEEINLMSDEALAIELSHVTVFARVTPEHKLRIIQAYRSRGEIIAMTGDGVNDTPSLVAADLGVAMGKIGTEVAKESADIILLDDNFANIVLAAEEGRGIYKSIKRVILYLFSTNIGEVLIISGALLLGYPLPLLAAQIIWLNVITDT
ncbi:MAG: HAD-IC family P-type ATPase, partial [Patescibacteria group bacterium]